MKSKIKVGSDFSGVGAFNQALMRLGIEYDEVFACDMDKYARQTFIHNYGEPEYYPTNVYDREIPKDSLDIYMTSPPCQAFSLAGKRLGKGDKRGILFFNSLEFIQVNRPRFFIFENVKGLLSDDNGNTFSEWVNLLGGKSVNGNAVMFPYEDAVPYHLYWKVLNAKHYGVPQNRERVFLVGIRDDNDNSFTWPVEEQLKTKLKDVLEDNVSEKYFLSEERINTITNAERSIGWTDAENKDAANCLVSVYSKQPTDGEYLKIKSATSKGYEEELSIGTWRTHEDGKGFREIEDGNCPTIPARAREDGSGQPVIKVKSATLKGYEEATEGDSINLAVTNSETRRGRVGKQVAQTLDTSCNQGVMVYNIPEIVKVRKHEFNIFKFQQIIKLHKNKTIKQIAEELNESKTTVEHWFRTDNSFSIPDAKIWYKLKKCLNIQTDEFDLPITEFEEKEGVFEKSNRVYHENGIAPTITSTSADERILTQNNQGVMIVKNGRSEEEKKRRKETYKKTGKDSGSFKDKELIIKEQDYSDTILANSNPKKEGLIATEVIYNDKRLTETVNKNKFTNGVPSAIDSYNQSVSETIAPTVKLPHNDRFMIDGYKIRRLTPRECFRLMDFPDTFTWPVSDSQAYKQAGNSIVVRVLAKIIEKLIFYGSK